MFDLVLPTLSIILRLGAAWSTPNVSRTAAGACQNNVDEGGSQDYAVHMLQTHARSGKRHSQCPAQKCQLEACCPKTPSDCITDADQVKQIFLYTLQSGKGSACIDYVADFLSLQHGGGVTLTADDLCVSSNLVMSTQIIVSGDPGSCLETMSAPTGLAPQLGCSPWAWFSDSSAILAFLKALYKQPNFKNADVVNSLLSEVSASQNPRPTATFPLKYAQAFIFDKTQGSGVPKIYYPNPAVLVQGPQPSGNTYGGDRTVSPWPPSVKFIGLTPYWWSDSQTLLTDCASGLPSTGVCQDAKAVLSKLSLRATRDLITKNPMEITGCPWTRAAQAEPGQEVYGPQKGDTFNFALNTGVYSCTGGLHQAWTCMVCPKNSKCIGPDADDVSGGFAGCGLDEAQRCIPVPWFGHNSKFPTAGCSADWLEDMHKWLADPRGHLSDLASKPSGHISAIQGMNTMMFVYDLLFTGGHSGWKTLGGLVHTDEKGNPTCSTFGASNRAGPFPPGTKCGEGDNLPCCKEDKDDDDVLGVRFAGAGTLGMEYVAANVHLPSSQYPCMTAMGICGPPGRGPSAELGSGVSATMECTPGA